MWQFVPTIELSTTECFSRVLPSITIASFTRTPASTTTPGPIATFGPIFAEGSMVADGSMKVGEMMLADGLARRAGSVLENCER
jgi:hypothetical protein